MNACGVAGMKHPLPPVFSTGRVDKMRSASLPSPGFNLDHQDV